MRNRDSIYLGAVQWTDLSHRERLKLYCFMRHDGRSLLEVRDEAVRRGQMLYQDWYEHSHWAHKRLPTGMYELRLPIEETVGKSRSDQLRVFRADEWLAPASLVVPALIFALGREYDPARGLIIRCLEREGHESVQIERHDGQLRLSLRDESHHPHRICACGVRRRP